MAVVMYQCSGSSSEEINPFLTVPKRTQIPLMMNTRLFLQIQDAELNSDIVTIFQGYTPDTEIDHTHRGITIEVPYSIPSVTGLLLELYDKAKDEYEATQEFLRREEAHWYASEYPDVIPNANDLREPFEDYHPQTSSAYLDELADRWMNASAD
jgi:hypothetical protein